MMDETISYVLRCAEGAQQATRRDSDGAHDFPVLGIEAVGLNQWTSRPSDVYGPQMNQRILNNCMGSGRMHKTTKPWVLGLYLQIDGVFPSPNMFVFICLVMVGLKLLHIVLSRF
jgi:hypothetical protein